MRLDFDFADVKPSVLNAAVVGTLAALWIVSMKFLTARYLPNTPLSDFWSAV